MALRSSALPLLLFFGIACPHPGDASPHKTTCTVEGGRADCSHLHLDKVPSTLPPDIRALDISHNRLVALDPAALRAYPGLEQVDASYNSMVSLGQGLCDALPRLQRLSVQRNQVLQLTGSELRNCSGLTHLDLSDNRLRLLGEPFSVMKSLTWLDVSRNKLTSARLGSQPQLPRLVTLILSGNDIATLKDNDFSFLSSSPSFRVLGLSSLPLKKIRTAKRIN